MHEVLTDLKSKKKKNWLKLRRGKRPKQTTPQTLFVVPVLERYSVIFPYLFIPLHFALSAIMQAPTRKVTLKYSKQVWSNILIKIHVVFKKNEKKISNLCSRSIKMYRPFCNTFINKLLACKSSAYCVMNPPQYYWLSCPLQRQKIKIIIIKIK